MRDAGNNSSRASERQDCHCTGAVVAAVYRDDEKFKQLLAYVGGEPSALEGISADVTLETDVRDMVEAVLRRHGRVDVLLNLAGAYRGGADIATMEERDWDFLMQTNLKSAFLCSKAVLPSMMKKPTLDASSALRRGRR
ncbi:MAG: SDR family NAD(P)-dependent oxidoreductase [Candidatus Aminicenantales bacterium]